MMLNWSFNLWEVKGGIIYIKIIKIISFLIQEDQYGVNRATLKTVNEK